MLTTNEVRQDRDNCFATEPYVTLLVIQSQEDNHVAHRVGLATMPYDFFLMFDPSRKSIRLD